MKDSSEFIKLASTDEFRDKRIKSFSVIAKPIAIIRDADDTYWATEIGCKHNNFDLTHGSFKGDIVRCPRHGWVYDIRSGECLNHSSAPLRRHALEVRGTDIYVSMFPVSDTDPDDEDDWDYEVKVNRS